MKSGKQRRQEIQTRRALRRDKHSLEREQARQKQLALRAIAVNVASLAPYNSYGEPDFVQRGYYIDIPFRCAGCGQEEVWTGTQQKWWYEVARGSVHSTAKLCRPCRRREQARRAEARRVHLDGVRAKKDSEPGCS